MLFHKESRSENIKFTASFSFILNNPKQLTLTDGIQTRILAKDVENTVTTSTTIKALQNVSFKQNS